MTKMSAAEITAHEILDPIVARVVAATEADEDATYADRREAEQLDGWVDGEINNSWHRGISGEQLAAIVAAKCGLTI